MNFQFPKSRPVFSIRLTRNKRLGYYGHIAFLTRIVTFYKDGEYKMGFYKNV